MLDKVKKNWMTIKKLWVLIRIFKANFFLCLFLIILNSFALTAFVSSLIPLITNIVSDVQKSSSPGFIKALFDLYLSVSPDKRQVIFALFGLFSLVVSSILGFAVIWSTSAFSAKVVTHTRKILVENILRLKYSFIAGFKEGKIIQLVITEARGVYAVTKQFLNLIMVFVRSGFIVVLLFFISYKITLFLALVGVGLLAVNYRFVRRIKNISHKGVKLRFKLMNFVKEMMTNLKQVKINVLEERMLDGLCRDSKGVENNIRDVRIRIELLPLITQFVIIMAAFAVVFASFKYDVFSSVMSPLGGLLSYLVVLSTLLPCIGKFNMAIGTIYSNMPAVGHVFEFFYNKDFYQDLNCERIEDYEGGRKRKTLLNNDFVFKNVTFSYTKENNDGPLLNNLSFKIEKGDKVAIVGRSGSGKTTMLNLIFRLYDIDDGSISFDGIDINQLNIIDLRKKIGYVSQDIKLFNTTIKENLLYANPDADFFQIQDACVKADAHDFIMRLPEKYDTLVGERGEKLSGGQRQRIAIAQVFLKNPEIIILDEAVSAVDFESASIIREGVFQKCEGKTIIIISHQVNSLLDVDKVLVLSQGEVKEFGSKNELLRDSNSLFYKMYHSQKV
ncbi:MAG: ABC transporter ATP-binding protein [Candidatus Omnitrophica bacterium]|nr:ABC transporter ATP-binding protein [Candidatus Omnitrophota bacterium]